jgi:thiamine pyrophosphokinase
VVAKDLNQDTTDFDKALLFIQDKSEGPTSIVAMNSFGGRLDHTLAVLNSAHAFETKYPYNVQFMNESCIARIIYQVLLQANQHN